jgi:hypothetical protein
VDGQLDASAPEGGNGGFIETSAAKVMVADSARVSTLAAQGGAGQSGKSGLWLIDPTDFTVAASGGDMTGAAVANALTSGNFSIQSSTGGSGTAGEVNINDAVTWSANTLTLDAAANINLNAPLTGTTSSANLVLMYGQGAVASGNTSLVAYTVPPLLTAGSTVSTKQGSNGSLVAYNVITALGTAGSTTGTDLQGMAGNLTRNYALGANIDASSTAGWNGGAGFAPVGGYRLPFWGSFNGLGHTISGLTINRPGPDMVGLFGLAFRSTLSNLSLTAVNITGGPGTGAAVGHLVSGTVSNISVAGQVSGQREVGGLAGRVLFSSYSGNRAAVNVSSTGDYAGGLIGYESSGMVASRDNSASGSVSGANFVGGLIGWVDRSNITNATASGAVSGNTDVGGLIGHVDAMANVSGSHASGNVTGVQSVGGLVGKSGNNSSAGVISNSGAIVASGSL